MYKLIHRCCGFFYCLICYNNYGDSMVKVEKTNDANFSWVGLFIGTILLLFIVAWFLVTYYPMFGLNFNIYNIMKFLDSNLAATIIMFFMFLFCCLIFLSFILDKVCRPKRQVLFLEKIEIMNNSQLLYFKDKKGRNFNCLVNSNNIFYKDKYYEVLKTVSFVHYIGNVVNDFFTIEESKKNFWFCWYLPNTKFENILVLPILYVLELFLIARLIQNHEFNLTMLFLVTFLIIYDIFYKLKHWK